MSYFSVSFCSTLLSLGTAVSSLIFCLLSFITMSGLLWWISQSVLRQHSLLRFWGVLIPFVAVLNSIFLAYLLMYDRPNNIMHLFILCLGKLGVTPQNMLCIIIIIIILLLLIIVIVVMIIILLLYYYSDCSIQLFLQQIASRTTKLCGFLNKLGGE